MFFGGDDDDQDFSLGGGGSKLASLFGMDKASSQGGNESLTYTAPKEPKKKKTGEASGSTPSVMCASAVHAYKFVDGKYASQGKLGLALIANPGAADYKLLLYVTKQQQVTNAQVTPVFKFTVLPNNYASFYDYAQQNWSMAFDGEQNLLQFAKQIALAKALYGGNALDTVIDQDLPPTGDGGALALGDSVELRYSGWLLQGNTYGPVFDSNASAEKLLRFKVGKGKCLKALDEGCVGMKRGSKRMLVVPAQLGYGTAGEGKVPPNATLIYEIEAVRVKLMREKEAEAISTSSEPPPPAIPVHQPHEADEEFKLKSKQLSEQHTQQPEKSDKAKLISRMAKMGRPMLPMTGAAAAQHNSDDESESTPATPDPVKPHIAAKPVAPSVGHNTYTPPPVTHHPSAEQAYHQQPYIPQQYTAQPVQPVQPSPFVMQGVPQSSQVAVFQPQMPMQPPFQQFGQQPPQYNQMYSQQPQSQYTAPAPTPSNNQSDNSMPVLLAESRQQNTEVRLSLTRVSDKIDRVHERIEQMLSHQSNALALSNNVPNMETSALMNTVQRIVRENEQLKKDVLDKGAKIELQNDKISELLQRNQKYVEQNNVFLEERNDSFKASASSSQAKVLSLEQEKVQIATELSAATSQISTLQLDIASIRKRETEYRSQLESTQTNEEKLRSELNSLKVQFTETERQFEQSSKDLKEERQLRKQVENRQSSLQEELSDLTAAHTTAEKALAERKKKSSQEKKQLEEELEELRQQHEVEVAALKEKLKSAKVSTGANAAQQVSQVEEELNQEWKEKCDRLLSAAQDKHQRELQELREEKAQVDEKVNILQEKMSNLKSTAGAGQTELLNLKEEVDELKVWKQKYETLRNNASAFKERYEVRLAEVEQQRDEAEENLQKTEVQRDQAIDAAKRAAAFGGASQGGMDKEALAAEVKKVMNSVYQELRTQFAPDQKFSGKDVQSTILNTVKSVTLRMVQDSEKEEQQEESQNGRESEEDKEEVKEGGKGAIAEKKEQMEPPASKTSVTNDKVEVTQVSEGLVCSPLPPVSSDSDNSSDSVDNSGENNKSIVSEANEGDINANTEVTQPSDIVPGEDGIDNQETIGSVELVKEENPLIDDNVHTAGVDDTGDHGNALVDINDEKRTSPEPSCVEQENEQGLQRPATESPIPEQDSSRNFDSDITENNTQLMEELAEEPVVMVSQSAAQTSSAAPSEKDRKLAAEKAPITGDKGNRYYAEELKKAAEKSTGVVISSTAHITGDKGNPYYAAELTGEDPKAKKIHDEKPKPKPSEAAILASIESLIVPGGDPSPPKKKKEEEKQKVSEAAILSAVEACIIPHSTPSLGSKPPSQADSQTTKSSKTADAIFASVGAIVPPAQADSKDKETKDTKPSKTADAIFASVGAMVPPAQGDSKDKIVEDTKPKQSEAAILEAVEACIIPGVASSTGAIPKTPKSSDDKEKAKSGKTADAILASVEACIIPDVEPKTTAKKEKKDKSSKDAQSAIFASVEAMMVPMPEESDSKAKAKKGEKTPHGRPEPKGGPIEPVTAHVTGDKGNPHYAKELDKAPSQTEAALFASVEACLIPDGAPVDTKPSPSNKDKQKESGKGGPIKAEIAPITGDKGNVHYAKELDKAAKSEEKVEAEVLAPQAAVLTSSAAPTSSKAPKAKDETKEKAHPSGDKGNPHHAAELDKAGAGKPARTPVKAEDAPITGDKGNVHYSEELDKAAVPDVIAPQSAVSTSSAPPKQADAEVISPQKVTTTSSAPPPKQADAEVISPQKVTTTSSAPPPKPSESKEKAHITGDKGNPFYAEELKKAGEKKPDPKLSAEEAPITGDRGNVHYAEELRRAAAEGDDKKKKESEKKSSETKPDKEISPDVLSAIEKQLIPGMIKSDEKEKCNVEKKKGEKKTSHADDLFGGDDDPLFSMPPAKKSAEKAKDTKKVTEKKTPAKSKEAKKEQGDSDDGMKPKPPPLFGDDDDDDDLDWLS